ncbi:hypothetical protein LCGC14_1782080 [marine sediment metagenome]|uniref:Uncharacterized protein n=1 Tax=marine sediment metagenome TaxID=412755 RepID=A0A0F9JUM9_9ZZZZ
MDKKVKYFIPHFLPTIYQKNNVRLMRVREIKRFMAFCMNMHFDEEETVERRFVFLIDDFRKYRPLFIMVLL